MSWFIILHVAALLPFRYVNHRLFLGPVVYMANLGIGIFLPSDVHAEPAVEVPDKSGQAMGEGSCAYFTKAVDLGKVSYFYYGVSHMLFAVVTLNGP